MAPFHNNKLNMVQLDDSDDGIYVPLTQKVKKKKGYIDKAARNCQNNNNPLPAKSSLSRKRKANNEAPLSYSTDIIGPAFGNDTYSFQNSQLDPSDNMPMHRAASCHDDPLSSADQDKSSATYAFLINCESPLQYLADTYSQYNERTGIDDNDFVNENLNDEDVISDEAYSTPSQLELNVKPASEDGEWYDLKEPPRKSRKTNKNGMPRKARQPRSALRKWDDEDWKKFGLAVVWACGEAGISIPFGIVANAVDVTCTAGALQQALLKLRVKMAAQGFEVPPLKMSWSRKIKSGAMTVTTTTTESNEQRTPSRQSVPSRQRESSRRPAASSNIQSIGKLSIGTNEAKKVQLIVSQPVQPTIAERSLVVTLPRAYIHADRDILAAPYSFEAYQRLDGCLTGIEAPDVDAPAADATIKFEPTEPASAEDGTVPLAPNIDSGHVTPSLDATSETIQDCTPDINDFTMNEMLWPDYDQQVSEHNRHVNFNDLRQERDNSRHFNYEDVQQDENQFDASRPPARTRTAVPVNMWLSHQPNVPAGIDLYPPIPIQNFSLSELGSVPPYIDPNTLFNGTPPLQTPPGMPILGRQQRPEPTVFPDSLDVSYLDSRYGGTYLPNCLARGMNNQAVSSNTNMTMAPYTSMIMTQYANMATTPDTNMATASYIDVVAVPFFGMTEASDIDMAVTRELPMYDPMDANLIIDTSHDDLAVTSKLPDISSVDHGAFSTDPHSEFAVEVAPECPTTPVNTIAAQTVVEARLNASNGASRALNPQGDLEYELHDMEILFNSFQRNDWEQVSIGQFSRGHENLPDVFGSDSYFSDRDDL